MAHSEFVHLHLHTQYSLLDGACRIPDILNLAGQYKMDSIAITDHGNMFGAVEFYMAAQKAGIKPIIGCEVYVAPKTRFDKTSQQHEDSSYHLILLAKDETGYQNLMKLVSIGYSEGFYYKPRIDKDMLLSYHDGLIGLSGCLKGEVPILLQQRRFNDALKSADELFNILGKENFYLEVQENAIPEQKLANEGLLKISKELGIPLAATNDVHYLKREGAASHEVLLCIQTQTTLNDVNRMRFQTDEFYFKSPEEMKRLFAEYPNAVSNTIEIAGRCNVELDFSRVHLPKYRPPQNKTKEEFLQELCESGLKNRFSAADETVRKRLDHELGTIRNMGFVNYFLIVWDFIRYAKENNIPVGPGRGSAAGSLVSYLLGITDIDPLKYGLLFERFLNPERIGLPDIDIDFCYERRQEVIDYVTKKYGQDNVAQIITFGTMQARAVVRDVGRVMGMEYQDVDRIAKMIPPDPGTTLQDALESEPELKNLYKNDAEVHRLVDTALSLEGLNRHASVHAAGVVITDKPLNNYMPLYKTNDGQITTGYSMSILEKIGLLKMDFLGLRTLTVVDQTVKLIDEIRNETVDLENLSLDDPKTYKLLADARTSGVFQLESAGMRDLLRKLEPEKFEDLIALLALYRPGPIGSGMLDDFIQRKHKRVPVKYDHKKLETILKETYGIMVYQEQIMQIASGLAGFSLSQADLLRRAMSKKIPEVMERQRKNFVTGCLKNNINDGQANKIFDLIEYFSGYGFNRSHSAAYALISYRTAYLKANYQVEFMCSLLTSERDNTDKIVEYVAESGRLGIKILPPDINESCALFKVIDAQTIRFGLIAVKNVGLGAIESIIEARKNGRFLSLDDFCQRIDSRLVNKKVIESLAKCGALDSFSMPRSQMVVRLGTLLDLASKTQKERSKGQLSFFDQDFSRDTFKDSIKISLPQIKEWPEPQILAFEKEMIGFYISGHPLARYASCLKRFASTSISNLTAHKDGDDIKIVGLICKIKQTVTRAKQEKMAIIKIEDLEGNMEALVFPKTYQKVSRYLLLNTVVLIRGILNLKEESPKVIVNDLFPMDDIYKLVSHINIEFSGIRENLFASLKDILKLNKGSVPVYLHLNAPNKPAVQLVVGEEFYAEPSDKLIEQIEELLGDGKIRIAI